MRDRRRVDELSIEELEQVLTLRKREAREKRLRRYRQTGRAIDAEISGDAFQPASKVKTRVQRTLSTALLVVEWGAVIGVLVVGWFFFQRWRDLNTVAQAEIAAVSSAIPTIEPTPIIGAMVLPSGHTPPTSPDGAQPNFEQELPAHLRPIVAAAPPVVLPTPTLAPEHAVRVVIPSINVDAPIVQGDNWEQLSKGVGQHIGTANPGKTGNIVLSAHNDIFGEIFRHLDRLTPGDEIQVYTANDVFTYRITGSDVVPPTAVEIMDPTRNPTITLISCYPYLIDTERIAVFGELVNSS